MAAEKRKSRGVVVNFHDSKGFGFIKLDGAADSDPDIFVHHSHLNSSGFRSLGPGQLVEFSLFKDSDKLKAADVIVVGPPSAVFTRRIGYRGGGGECYTCGNSGHFSRDCYQSNGGNRGGNETGVCYTCGGIGHMARECPTGRKRGCFNCRNIGHMAADCGTYQNGGGRNGGGAGFSRFAGNVKACFNCGEQGHMAKDCQEYSAREGGRTGENGNGGAAGGFCRQGCFKCGEPGHFARECIAVK